jgi:RHS repeat-associated protein
VHDFAGRRTSIMRAGRTWTYGYDKNGNMTSEQVPGSTGPLEDLLYTTTTGYDDLDRPVSRVIGPRLLSAEDQALFGSDTEVLSWDVGPNHKGYLRFWRSYAPGAGTPMALVDLWNDQQGRTWAHQHTLNLPGFPSLLRRHEQFLHLSGQPRLSRYFDNMGGSAETTAEYFYDARHLPSYLRLQRTNEPEQDIADQTRNVAGLVTNRRTETTGPMPYVESNWTYDKLGRVTNQEVLMGPGSTQVVRQNLSYFGNDDPQRLTHYLGTTSRQFDHTFDYRHQLTNVTTTGSPGYFDATYAFGSAGRFTRATETSSLPPGSDVKPRDVNYQYGNPDPEQVTALVHASGPQIGTNFASYTYDAAGNQTSRCYSADTRPPCPGEAMEYVYDGKDQLRRATKMVNGIVTGSEVYWYDHDGQRIAVLKRDANGDPTELVWFNKDVQAHYDASGTVTHTYSHLSLGTPVARVKRTSNTATSVEYQFHGLASNTIAAVAHDGTINASFSYAPFGEVIEATDVGGQGAGTAVHQRRLNDKHQDKLSALAYYGFRYYDQTLIGWTQADPLYRFQPDRAWNMPRRSNLYSFVLGNPLRLIDPDGREVTEAPNPAEAPKPPPRTTTPNSPKTMPKGTGQFPIAKPGVTGRVGGWAAVILLIGEGVKRTVPKPYACAVPIACLLPDDKEKPDTPEGPPPGTQEVPLPEVPPRPRHLPRWVPWPPQPHPDFPRARVIPKSPSKPGETGSGGSSSGDQQKNSSNKPADYNGDGNVDDNEMSTWSTNENDKVKPD